MDPCWKNLPIDLVYKICNMLTKVRRLNARLAYDIKYQWHAFDRYYYNAMSLFGLDQVWWVLYDDLRNIADIQDTYEENNDLEYVVREMWKSATQEQRYEIVVHY
jgi:hypothetical protein